MLELRNITYKYNNDFIAIKNFNLKIKSGEFVAVVGRNGSGKSTLALILSGILKDYEGKFYINGKLPSSEFFRKKIGILFQDPDNQLVSSIVKTDIAFGLENRKIEPHKMDEYIDQALKRLDIYHLKEFPVTSLSGGEKQKVALAGIFVMNFDIFIFDEATSMLDPESAKEILEEIQRLHKMGKTIIMITHKQKEAKLAERIIELKGEHQN